MYNPIQVTTTLPSVTTSISRSPLRRAFLLIPLALAWFALSPAARAVCQEGCDTGSGNTFLGDDALLNNTAGVQNTALGFNALFSNTTGNQNTANGNAALSSNTIGSQNTATGQGALSGNTTGTDNTANGVNALVCNTAGYNNTGRRPAGTLQ